jgi:DnaJ-class molecular chaperone
MTMDYETAAAIVKKLQKGTLKPTFGDSQQIEALAIVEKYCPECHGSGDGPHGEACTKCGGTGRRRK